MHVLVLKLVTANSNYRLSKTETLKLEKKPSGPWYKGKMEWKWITDLNTSLERPYKELNSFEIGHSKLSLWALSKLAAKQLIFWAYAVGNNEKIQASREKHEGRWWEVSNY